MSDNPLLAARDEAVVQFLTAHIGKPTPLNREIAEHLGVSVGTADSSLRRLDKVGRISTTGNGSQRSFCIHGVGSTVAIRGKIREVVAVVEPVRVDNWICRCGSRNCTAHSRIPLTVSLRAGQSRWVG